MRVALLSHNAQAGDAIGNQVAEKLSFFLDRGADVRVFVESDRDLHPTVRPHCFTLRPDGHRGPEWAFVTASDLVVAEYGQHYALLQLLPLLAGGRPRLLIDYHGVTPPELWGLQNREALDRGVRQRGLMGCADGVLVHSHYTHRELLTDVGLPAERLHRLAFPVDLDAFTPGPSVHWRKALGLEGARVLLFVGRLAPNKRVPVLVEALARLRDLDPPVHALVAGTTADVYRAEARRCRDRAAELGVADRLHFIGHLTGERLADAYRAADVFVTPSAWESFCIPVVEAMACGVPVVAARAAALPETVGDAGLTFRAEDVDDLERQLRRVLLLPSPPPGERGWGRGEKNAHGTQPVGFTQAVPEPLPRVALVSFRYGADFAGGAEASLRAAAEALRDAGCRVEVFTTCARHESVWADELPAGTTAVNGIPVHRFPIDPHDRARHLEGFRALTEAGGRVAPTAEAEYLRHSIHSSQLVDTLVRRAAEFDAVLTGPYLYGLTWAVARALPERTVVVPCFHDEPLARLAVWPEVYGRVGGILYHSPEEQHFAEAELGLNHPGAACMGTYLNTEAGDPEAGRRAAGTAGPYVVYAGRYSPQKELPALFEHARRYHRERPGRLTFVFMGQGPLRVPDEPWARDLGFVDEAAKRDVLAGAVALVQPSPCESLSLAALEAWAQGTPVLADARSAVLAGHLRRSGGGRGVAGYEGLARALDELSEALAVWQEMGERGRAYVRATYGSRAAFTGRLLEALRDLNVPPAERMRRRGLARAATFGRPAWRERFAAVVEHLLDTGPRPQRFAVEVRPRRVEHTVAAGARAVLVPVRVLNRGTHPLTAEGPARGVLRARVEDEGGQPATTPAEAIPLPALLAPGRALAAAVPVPVPAEPGTYRVAFWCERADANGPPAASAAPDGVLRLVVEGQGRGDEACSAALDAAQAALVEAGRLQHLPDDYTDVTEGVFASVKRRVKRKLLGNFKHAYVDVLSRQQSGFNGRLVAAVQELAECCATLDHAVRVLLQRVAELEGAREDAQQETPRAAARGR